ncbi:L rhamnose-proton symporter [Escherichia coli]|uniref:L rhamnose-proton symporter n=1 Tax=Escherichia coli TaxID=562 RepID=A0A376X5X1_ECOLX|nr:L rhamnose-proton symporter [Escherichia coli]
MVMGNHVVSRWDCFVDYSAVGHQRPVTTEFLGVLQLVSLSTLLPVFLFGAMWGIGNINYGLTMHYLGMSMGIGIAIGIT